MSSEIKSKRRPYRQKARARKQQETRQRITEAVVELHRTVGPARTTISEVAERAGVGRMTVYKHFPTDTDLFRACGQHWSAQHPPPDFSPCLAHDQPGQRAQCVLRKLYAHYRATHDMMGKVLRDAPLMPPLQQVVAEGWLPLIEELENSLVAEAAGAARQKRMRATVRVALDLHTWETLVHAGLSDRQAADVAAGWLENSASQAF